MGVLTLLAFVVTGQLMRHHNPPMASLSVSTRLLYRSRHIYILASGLVNLMLGMYMRRRPARWRAVVQWFGSVPVLVSPALRTVAFTVEPTRGFQADMPWSAAGLYALFGGCMVHFVGAARSTEGKP